MAATRFFRFFPFFLGIDSRKIGNQTERSWQGLTAAPLAFYCFDRPLKSPGMQEGASEVEPGEILYHTYSLCRVCSLVEGKGPNLNLQKGTDWVSAEVRKNDGKVWLLAKCKTHGTQRTLYCSNAAFFERIRSYTLDSHFMSTLVRSPH